VVLRGSSNWAVTPPTLDTTPAPALELSDITKSFGSSIALASASVVVRRGTIHAVLGENGAGKTTLMRIAYGMVRPDSGNIQVDGRVVRFASPIDAIAAGIGMVHQHFTLVPTMTVAENLALGGHGRLRRRDMVDHVRVLAARTGFALDPHARVEDLSVGAQQRVEIAKALVRDASLLILDEPTAVLAPTETDDLLRWLRGYVADGRSAVLVTHKLRDALAVADDVTVLRNGRRLYTGVAAQSSIPQLTSAMMGSAVVGLDSETTARDVAVAHPVFRAERMRVADATGRTRIREASFVVYAGERLGVAAVEGSGQRELLRALAGRIQISSGVLDRPATVGFVPEDRHTDAVLLDGSLVENVALRGAGRRAGLVPWKEMRQLTSRLIALYDVRATDGTQTVRTLSGGNQQKLILARELEASVDEPAPLALVVENPTRGLDVHATAAVHERLRVAAARGAAIVVYSSDLDEVLAMATRVLVVFDGYVAEVPADRSLIAEAMLGMRVSVQPSPKEQP